MRMDGTSESYLFRVGRVRVNQTFVNLHRLLVHLARTLLLLVVGDLVRTRELEHHGVDVGLEPDRARDVLVHLLLGGMVRLERRKRVGVESSGYEKRDAFEGREVVVGPGVRCLLVLEVGGGDGGRLRELLGRNKSQRQSS